MCPVVVANHGLVAAVALAFAFRASQAALNSALTVEVLIAATLFGADFVTSAAAASIGGFVGGLPSQLRQRSYGRARRLRLVAHRVMTHHGWQIRRVRVCS
jgi:hypothetical protein